MAESSAAREVMPESVRGRSRIRLGASVLVVVLLVGCATLPTARSLDDDTPAPTTRDPVPELDPTRTRVVIALGHFVRGAYHPDIPCEPDPAPVDPEFELICFSMDPPPMRLTFAVSEVVYGGPLPSRLALTTGSHWGLPSIPFDAARPYLVVIHTDGRHALMPRYAKIPVARTRNGEWAIPFFERDSLLWMLPCAVASQARPLVFADPAARVRDEPGERYWADAFDRNPNLQQRGEWYHAVRGIPISSVRKTLRSMSLTPDTTECKR